MPKNNKIFFISNAKSSKIVNYLRKNYEREDQEVLKLLKNSISEYVKQENNKYAITVYQNPSSSIIQYKPITHKLTHNFHSFPNTA